MKVSRDGCVLHLSEHHDGGVEHDHRERNHQGVANRLLTLAELAVRPGNGSAPVERRERLGELLSFYYRPAA